MALRLTAEARAELERRAERLRVELRLVEAELRLVEAELRLVEAELRSDEALRVQAEEREIK
jgi:hypothetical protein